jgi:hypothetical protein
MTDEVEGTAKGAGNFLTQKVGPLPIGVWMVAALGIYLYLKNKSAAAAKNTGPTAVTPAGTVGTTGGIGSSDMSGGGGGSTGNTGTSGSTTAGQYQTNDAWGRAAVNYLVSIGEDPTVANSAITQFLASQNLTADQQAMVNLAIQSLGAPPNLPQPGTAPPPVNNPPGTVYAANPPTGLSASNAQMNSVDLTWNKVTNATAYTVKYSAPGVSQQTLSVNGTDTHVTVGGLSAGTRYEFQVQAVPAKPGDSYASTSATTANGPTGQPPASQPPADPHAGQHLQPPQVATLVHGVSMAHWAAEHPGNSLSVLETLNPTLGPNDTTHPTMMIRTSNERWVNN